jgi:hypothetical protein
MSRDAVGVPVSFTGRTPRLHAERAEIAEGARSTRIAVDIPLREATATGNGLLRVSAWW